MTLPHLSTSGPVVGKCSEKIVVFVQSGPALIGSCALLKETIPTWPEVVLIDFTMLLLSSIVNIVMCHIRSASLFTALGLGQ